MRPITKSVTVSGQTNSEVVGFDYFMAPFNIGVQTSVSVGSSATYSVQYTLDDIQSSTYSAATGNWTNISTISGATVSGNATTTVSAASHTIPCTGMRIATSGLSGTVSAVFILNGAGGQ